jgi:hypothetical protein
MSIIETGTRGVEFCTILWQAKGMRESGIRGGQTGKYEASVAEGNIDESHHGQTLKLNSKVTYP